MDKTEKVLIALFLLAGAILRFYNFWDFSLSNDELSALARLNFDSFSELLHEGIKIDGHPPAAQVILWYVTKWFGNGVFVVRLPFVIAGVLTLWFLYKTARVWIGKSGALLTIATYSTLIFPLLYSRIARPYALGMLFIALSTYFWIRIVKEQQSNRDYLFLAISLVLAAYSHYFAALVGALLAIIGVFLIRKSQWKHYILSMVFGAALFAPYVPIFLFQLNTGGVGQWLGAPEYNWLWSHLQYSFNGSIIILVLVVLISVAGFISFRKSSFFLNSFLPLVLFLLPFDVCFYYSRIVNPVLQNSTLLFSFPYLLIFLFSGWEGSSLKKAIPASIFIFLITIGNSTITKAFYQTNHFGVFKEIAQHITDWRLFTENDVTSIGDFNAPFYINYYLNDNKTLDLYRTSNDSGLIHLKTTLQNSSSKYAIYAWSTINQVAETEPLIKQFFPAEIERHTYFNSEAVLFKKGDKTIPATSFHFKKTAHWNFNKSKLAIDSAENSLVTIDNESPYGPTFQWSVKDLTEKGVSSLTVKVLFSIPSSSEELQIVFEQLNEEGGYVWESDKLAPQIINKNKDWAIAYFELKETEKLGDVKIYVWSPQGAVCELQQMDVWFD